MQELINRVVAAAGLDHERAEKAVGIILSLVRSQGPRDKVDRLFDKLPGAAVLADRHGRDGAVKGGLLGGLLGGGLMGAPLAAVGKLQAAGLSMGEIKAVGYEVLAYAKEKAGTDLVRDVAGSIPGLSGYV
jgi:predicted lipid-binding transport protein (Tim44 family)